MSCQFKISPLLIEKVCAQFKHLVKLQNSILIKSAVNIKPPSSVKITTKVFLSYLSCCSLIGQIAAMLLSLFTRISAIKK